MLDPESEMYYMMVASNIELFGHHIQGVARESSEETATPSFHYTIGLSPKYGFEIIVFGLPYEFGAIIINSIADSLEQGFTIEPDKVYDPNEWAQAPALFKKATHPDLYEKFAVQAARFYHQEVPVLQLVLPDRNMKFPDDPEYEQEYMGKRQILLY